MNCQETIAELRKSLSILQIAMHVGVTVQAIHQLKNGENQPKASTAGALERLLKREKVVQNARKRYDSKDAI